MGTRQWPSRSASRRRSDWHQARRHKYIALLNLALAILFVCAGIALYMVGPPYWGIISFAILGLGALVNGIVEFKKAQSLS